MNPADRTNFLLDDFFILSPEEDLGKEELGTFPDPKGSGFDLSNVPYLDFNNDYRQALKDRVSNVYHPEHKDNVSYIRFYNGGSYIEGENFKTDTRIESGAKDHHKSKIDGNLDQGRSGRYIKEFSPKSQRNMRNELCKINLEHLEGKNRPLFVTLTVADDIEGEGITSKCQGALQRFKKETGDDPIYKELCGMWKLEFQKNEKPHFHIVMWGVPFVCHEWLADTWHKSLYPDAKVREKNKKHLESGSSIGKIHGISKREFKEGQDEIKNAKWKRVGGKNGAFKKATNYLTKYLTKDYTDIPDDWSNARFWGYLNMDKFKSYQEPVVIETTQEQYEAISRAKTKVLNNRKRFVVNLNSKMKYIIKNTSKRVNLNLTTDDDGFTHVLDELGNPIPNKYDLSTLDTRRFRSDYEGDVKVDYGEYKAECFELNDGVVEIKEPVEDTAYATELISNVYTTELIKSLDGREEWHDTHIGVLTEERKLNSDAYITVNIGDELVEMDNPKYMFGFNYTSKFVLKNNNGEIIEEYNEFKDFDGIVLACESHIYSGWSAYGVEIEEVLEMAYPDSTFELKGSFITSYNKDNKPKEVTLLCKLQIHKQQPMQLQKAS